MLNLTTIAHTLQQLFTAEATRLAWQTGLVRRHSKLTGPLILLILVAGFIQHPMASYNILAQVAADYEVPVTRQAIQQRLTVAAVHFFQALFQQSLRLLQSKLTLSLPLLTQFSAVYVLDSSQVAVPARLRTEYPAPGGDGPAAGIKLQVLWELLDGCLQEVLGQAAKESDQRYDGYLAHLRAGSLILFDLGYVALTRLVQLIARRIYFICRWNPRFEAFTPAGAPFDLRASLATCAATAREWDLRIGVRAHVPLRVVAFKVPDEVREQRRRRAHATERKRGFTYSAAYKALLDWNVYVTNVPPGRLTAEQVSMVYRLRWQVELLFKLWKTQGQLDTVAGQKRGRVLCELYAKLIGMAVFGYLTAPVRLREARELSPVRAWQVWQRQIEKVATALRKGGGVGAVLRRLYALWEQFGWKDQRPDRPTSLGRLRDSTPSRAAPRPWPRPGQVPPWVAIRASPAPAFVKSLT